MTLTFKSQNQSAVKKRILVVDDHPIVRQGLALLINREADLVVCGEAEEATAALHVLASARPDVLIVDISLNGPDGLDLLKNIRTTHPHLPVLILSMHDETIYAERALRAGANGYIMKQEATEKVLVAVRRIHILWITAGLGCDGDSVPSPRPRSPASKTSCWAPFPACPRCTCTIPCSPTRTATTS
jgi:CheY-like chemotaxis protein